VRCVQSYQSSCGMVSGEIRRPCTVLHLLMCAGTSRIRSCTSCSNGTHQPCQPAQRSSCSSSNLSDIGFLVRAASAVVCRYFTHQELHELFKWDPSALAVSETQQLLKQQHKPSAELASFSSHVSWLEAHALCAGTSEHSLLFSHHDPEGKHLGLDPTHQGQHAPGSAAAAAAGLQRPGLGVSGYGRTGARAVAGAGAAGPSAAELSNMLSSLNIASRPGGGSSASVGGSGGSSRAGEGPAGDAAAANELQQQQEKQQRCDSLQVEVQHLQYQLGRVTADLATVGPRLPDGGSKVRREE
jgi:hypothetical protein